MHTDRYMLFDRDSMYDTIHDDDWLASLADSLGKDDPSELTDDEIFGQADFEIQSDFEEEVDEIGRAFDRRCEELHPEWGGGYQLMALGSVGRWDGTSTGHNYYSGRWEPAPTESHPYRQVRTSPFRSLVTDTWRSPNEDSGDRFGLFADCEIDQIWEDRDGTIHVRGVHHDGEVNVEVRAVAPDAEEQEDERFLAWYVEDYDQDAHRSFLERAWEGGVRANMAEHYGYRWPALDEASPVSEVTGALNMSKPVEVDGYRVNGIDAVRIGDADGETYSLELVAEDGGMTFAYYCSEYADETGGVLLFEVGDDGPCRLCSDNWLASSDYVEACDRVAAGELSPIFQGGGTRALAGEALAALAGRRQPPSAMAASAKACSSAARTQDGDASARRLQGGGRG